MDVSTFMEYKHRQFGGIGKTWWDVLSKRRKGREAKFPSILYIPLPYFL